MMSHARLLTLSLLVAAGVLVAVIGWQFSAGWDGRSAAPTPTSQRSGTLPEIPKLAGALPPLDAFDEIVERPLFTEGRRPPAPDATPEAKNQPAPQWQLHGTIITTEERSALLWDVRNRRHLVLQTGMSQAGWELAEIQPEGVILRNGQTQHEIKLPRF